MDIVGRLFKSVHWIMFGKMDEQKRAKLQVVLRSFVKILESVKKEAKDIEVVANKNGEVTIRFHKEF